ncbi:hypothetical protein J8273_5569 [Carpediemonas membranifera]|uniref:Uncharacterized protein n=1 Tax=Carpediemonas membranifera TaxID=201153 RepID=A0A8J6E3C8_9EUKA|nr:hypothetical protein J8273_5569 [Carpediemonas membranifera]|eukprot:KAG9392977.1 hypothetical protein J8273_5569 [Carpediemonas membranifera]
MVRNIERSWEGRAVYSAYRGQYGAPAILGKNNFESTVAKLRGDVALASPTMWAPKKPAGVIRAEKAERELAQAKRWVDPTRVILSSVERMIDPDSWADCSLLISDAEANWARLKVRTIPVPPELFTVDSKPLLVIGATSTKLTVDGNHVEATAIVVRMAHPIVIGRQGGWLMGRPDLPPLGTGITKRNMARQGREQPASSQSQPPPWAGTPALGATPVRQVIEEQSGGTFPTPSSTGGAATVVTPHTTGESIASGDLIAAAAGGTIATPELGLGATVATPDAATRRRGPPATIEARRHKPEAQRFTWGCS